MSKPNEPKFRVGDLVLYKGGLFKISEVRKHQTYFEFENYGLDDIYKIGDIIVAEEELTKADWRDIQRITKGGAK